MGYNDWIQEKLQTVLNGGTSKLAIVPMGKNGKLVKGILEKDFGIRDVLCFDNIKYDNKTVYPLEMNQNWHTDIRYIISAQDFYLREEIKNQLLRHVREEQIIVLFSDDRINDLSNKYGKVNLDFLCVGFPKCGTTSLFEALRHNPNIFLPSAKETHFVNNIYDPAAHRRFNNFYSERKHEKLTGGIEPTYYRKAKEVSLYFGKDIKLLICVRNPVEAAFSLFKMEMRIGNATYYQNKYRKNFSKAFDEWLDKENGKESLKYMDYIREYLKYYAKEQIKIVVLEDLIANTGRIMDEMQKFIGLEADERIGYEEFPHMNKGNKMPQNAAAAKLDHVMMGFVYNANPAISKVLAWLRMKTKAITNSEYNDKIQGSTMQKLNGYYARSIDELERFIGSSLKNLWY